MTTPPPSNRQIAKDSGEKAAKYNNFFTATNTCLSLKQLMVKSYQLLGNIDPVYLPEAFEIFNKTAVEVCEGQQLDMDFQERNDVTIHEYIEMIRLKTAVLLGSALSLGAIVADASDDDKTALRVFGENIGIAFQIQDDILDTFGDEGVGKKIGGDILQNKKTYLYLKGLELASDSQRAELQTLYSTNDLPEDQKIERVTALFKSLVVKE